MQIPASPHGASDIIRDLPSRLVAALAAGHKLEATVIAKLAPDIIKLKVADTILQIKSDQNFQMGQKVSLEQNSQTSEVILKSIQSAKSVESLLAELPSMKQGQTVAVEVIKLLTDKRVLVSPLMIRNSNQPTNTQNQSQSTVPLQIEVDTTALKHSDFKVGDKLAMAVVTEQPLTVQFKAESSSRAQVIQDYQRELLPQIDKTKPQFTQLNLLLSKLAERPELKQAVVQLMNNVKEKSMLQQPEVLKSAIQESGGFLEAKVKTISTSSQVIQHDFKANLLKLSEAIQQQLKPNGPLTVQNNDKVYQSLPLEIQQALRQVVSSPEAMQRLPAQIQSFLAAQGQTPANLLLGLMNALRPSSPTETAQAALASQLPQSQTTSVLGQGVMNSRELQANQNTPVSRVVDVQMLREVLREVDAASARIQSNQLNMLKDPDTLSNTNVWLFDLPVKERQQLEMLQMRLEQNRNPHKPEEEAIWQVQLNLETVNLGPMQAQIDVHNGTVSVVILAERPSSAHLLQQHVALLEERLVDLGVSVRHLSCRQAPVHPISAHAPVNAEFSKYVDISV